MILLFGAFDYLGYVILSLLKVMMLFPLFLLEPLGLLFYLCVRPNSTPFDVLSMMLCVFRGALEFCVFAIEAYRGTERISCSAKDGLKNVFPSIIRAFR